MTQRSSCRRISCQGCSWTVVVSLALSVTILLAPRERAGAAESRGGSPAAQAKRPAPTVSLVGTIVAIVPESRTILLDVPVGADVLRVGAEVTGATTIEERGGLASFEDLQTGRRVRLTFRRIATGNEAISVQILPGTRG